MKKLAGFLLALLFSGCFSSGSNDEYVNPNQQYYNDMVAYFNTLPVIENSTIMIGDSLTERGNWESFFPGKNIINFGISGDNSEGVLKRIQQTIDRNPSKVFLMIGTNDFYAPSPGNFIPNYDEIVKTLTTSLPNTKIYVQSMLPARNNLRNNSEIESLNLKIQTIAAKYSVTYLDLYPEFIDNYGFLREEYTVDNLHLNDAGYQNWVELITQYM